MTSDQVLTLFREAGALLEGHFSLSSGLHSPGYLQCARVLQHPRHAQALGEAIAVRAREWRPAAVLSPALGGVVIGHEVARALETRGIFAERAAGELTLRRGFTVDAGERVVIVEDVVTTGKSTRETIEVARAAGADVVGAASVIDRSAGADLGVPFFALASVALPTYEPAECPLCASGTAIIKPGSRPGPSPR